MGSAKFRRVLGDSGMRSMDGGAGTPGNKETDLGGEGESAPGEGEKPSMRRSDRGEWRVAGVDENGDGGDRVARLARESWCSWSWRLTTGGGERRFQRGSRVLTQPACVRSVPTTTQGPGSSVHQGTVCALSTHHYLLHSLLHSSLFTLRGSLQ